MDEFFTGIRNIAFLSRYLDFCVFDVFEEFSNSNL